MKNLLVVARYNEDISWVDDLNCTVIVYNKGDVLDPKYNSIEVPNYGREAETYLRSIKDFYESFEEFDHITFLQGNPFDQSPDILSMIPQDHKNLSFKYPCPISTDNTVWFSNGNRAYAFRSGYGEMIADGTYDDEYLKIIKNTVESIGLPWYDNWIEYAGGQFIIPKKYILSKSHYWWTHLYDLFECSEKHLYKDIKYPGMAYVFEKLWHLIFTFY